MSEGPLSAADARIDDADGAVLLDALSFDSAGSRVGLVGGWEPLFRLLLGEARLARGRLDVLGHDATFAAREGLVGVARADPVLPPRFTVLEYLTASGRLLGRSRRAATRLARDTLERLGARTLGKRRVATLNPTERRAAGILAAVLGDPPVLVLEGPLSGLDEAAGAAVETLVARAAAGRVLVASLDAPAGTGPEAAFLLATGHVVVLSGGRVVASGTPTEVLRPSPRYVVGTSRSLPALVRELSLRGLHVDGSGVDLPEGGRIVVEVSGERGTDAIVDAALAAGAPLSEMVPVAWVPRRAAGPET